MDRLDPGPIYLGHVRRVHEHEGDGAPEEHVIGYPRDPQARDAEAEKIDDEDARYGPEQVDVDRRQQPNRKEDRSRQPTEDRQHEAEREDEDLGDQEQRNVRPEGLD